MSVPQRIDRLRRTMRERGLDAMLVSQPLNVYYTSGFRPMMWNIVQPAEDPEGFVVVEQDRVSFLCDARYDPAPAIAQGAVHEKIEAPACPRTVAAAIHRRIGGRVKRLGFEAGSILHSDATGLFAAMPGVEWVAADELLAQQRVCKDAAEQQLLRDAARVTDGAFSHALTTIREGMTEKELADEINQYLRTHSEGISFNSIVAFGETSAAPHYEPSAARKLARGHLILMDCGANYHGYMGDMTRTVVFGKATDKQKKMYQLVLDAQEAVLRGLRPNMTGHEADSLARDSFKKAGVLDLFLHGTGHGVGLAIHEPPRLKETFDNPLSPGVCVTVEPGLYEKNWGGIRIEDVVIMHDDGPENITKSPKRELIEV